VRRFGNRAHYYCYWRGKNAIEDHFDSSPELESFLESKGKSDLAKLVRDIGNMVRFSYTRQKEPLGLGHAVLVAKIWWATNRLPSCWAM